jgi:hypothetical protein
MNDKLPLIHISNKFLRDKSFILGLRIYDKTSNDLAINIYNKLLNYSLEELTEICVKYNFKPIRPIKDLFSRKKKKLVVDLMRSIEFYINIDCKWENIKYVYNKWSLKMSNNNKTECLNYLKPYFNKYWVQVCINYDVSNVILEMPWLDWKEIDELRDIEFIGKDEILEEKIDQTIDKYIEKIEDGFIGIKRINTNDFIKKPSLLELTDSNLNQTNLNQTNLNQTNLNQTNLNTNEIVRGLLTYIRTERKNMKVLYDKISNKTNEITRNETRAQLFRKDIEIRLFNIYDTCNNFKKQFIEVYKHVNQLKELQNKIITYFENQKIELFEQKDKYKTELIKIAEIHNEKIKAQYDNMNRIQEMQKIQNLEQINQMKIFLSSIKELEKINKYKHNTSNSISNYITILTSKQYNAEKVKDAYEAIINAYKEVCEERIKKKELQDERMKKLESNLEQIKLLKTKYQFEVKLLDDDYNSLINENPTINEISDDTQKIENEIKLNKKIEEQKKLEMEEMQLMFEIDQLEKERDDENEAEKVLENTFKIIRKPTQEIIETKHDDLDKSSNLDSIIESNLSKSDKLDKSSDLDSIIESTSGSLISKTDKKILLELKEYEKKNKIPHNDVWNKYIGEFINSTTCDICDEIITKSSFTVGKLSDNSALIQNLRPVCINCYLEMQDLNKTMIEYSTIYYPDSKILNNTKKVNKVLILPLSNNKSNKKTKLDLEIESLIN